MRRDVYQAIADPTRREIISILSKQSLNLNGVAEKFDISRPAISKQIKILTQCGVILIKRKGRERYCKVDLKSFDRVAQWMYQCRIFWTGKLDALEMFLNEETKSSKKSAARKAKKHYSKPGKQSSYKNKKS
jgi:DNA-binding transcriptional ArsR family regulator